MSAQGHAQAFEQPGANQEDQPGAVVATDIDPVLGRSQQEAAQNGPAETKKHFVRVPLQGADRARRESSVAGEEHRPGERQQGAGQTAKEKERAKTYQPEGMMNEGHGQIVGESVFQVEKPWQL